MPPTVDRKVMTSVMNTHRFEHVRYEYVPGAENIPYLARHESRRLKDPCIRTSTITRFRRAAPLAPPARRHDD